RNWHIPDPEVQPEFYADVPTKRLLAWLVDTVIILLFSALIIPFTAFTAIFFFPILVLIVGFIYRTVTIARGSATWGMRFFAIEFRTLAGARLDTSQAALHTLGLTVSFAFILLQVVSVILMLTSARGQGLSDLLLGTVAVNQRAAH
ncbi:MAG: RDD family protein, partial [Pseudomonadota bacterium]